MENVITFKKPEPAAPTAAPLVSPTDNDQVIESILIYFERTINLSSTALQGFHFTTPPLFDRKDHPPTYMVMREFAKHVKIASDYIRLSNNPDYPERTANAIKGYTDVLNILDGISMASHWMRIWDKEQDYDYTIIFQLIPNVGWYVDDIISRSVSLKLQAQITCYDQHS